MNPQSTSERGGRRSPLSSIAIRLYASSRNPTLRDFARRAILRFEGGQVYSLSIRRLLKEFHNLNVGLFTIGPCEYPPGNLEPGTSIGRYSSIYNTVRTLTSSDPAAVLATERLFLPEAFGEKTSLPRGELSIGNDVWMGHNVVILPTVRSVGDGAVVGAGSVVSKDIPPFAVVTGNPARVVRYRFSERIIQELIESQWWSKPIDELEPWLDLFNKPVQEGFKLATISHDAT